MDVFTEFTFEAAHRLPHVPATHKCARLHGHSYQVTVHVRGAVGVESGWVIDYAEIAAAVEPLVAQLDHHCVNDLPGLSNPTSEHLAIWLWERLAPSLPLYKIVVRETASAGSVYRGPGSVDERTV